MIISNKYRSVTLMCENCYNLIHRKVGIQFDNAIRVNSDFSIDFTEYYYCNNCGEYTFHNDIDTGIADLIQYLNKNGVKTRYCCQGHARATYSKYIDDDTNKEVEDTDKYIVGVCEPYIIIVEDESTNIELIEKIKAYDTEYWHSIYDINKYCNDNKLLSVRFKYSAIEEFEDQNDTPNSFGAAYVLADKEQEILDKAVKELSDYIMGEKL